MRFGFLAAVVGTILVLSGLVFLLRPSARGSQGEVLFVYYAAGLRLPIEDALEEYRREYGIEFITSAHGSGELQGNIVASEKGDLFIAADISYLEQLQSVEKDGKARDFIEEILPIAWQRPVIAVAKDNPKRIQGLTDLLRDDVQVSLADPAVAAIGRVAKRRMDAELWNRIWNVKHVGRPTVTMVASDVALGAADAGIVWDATAAQYAKLTTITVPKFNVRQSQIAVGILSTAQDLTRARHFARYLAADEAGLRHFQNHGYRVARGSVEIGSSSVPEHEVQEGMEERGNTGTD